MPAPRISAATRLQMAALIAAVRTAKQDSSDFQGYGSPKTVTALNNSLWIANKLCHQALTNHPEWFVELGDKLNIMVNPLHPTPAELETLQAAATDADKLAAFEVYVSALAERDELRDELSDDPTQRQLDQLKLAERAIKTAFESL